MHLRRAPISFQIKAVSGGFLYDVVLKRRNSTSAGDGMKTLSYICGLVLVSGIIYNPVLAQPRANKHLQLQGIISNVGLGGSLGYNFSPQWMLGGDFSGFNMWHKNTAEFSEVSHLLLTIQVYCRFYPDFQSGLPKWCEGIFGGLYCQAGMARRDWKIRTMEGDLYAGGMETIVHFPPIAALAGLGFNWVLHRGLSFGVGANLYIGTKPDALFRIGSPSAAAGGMTGIRSRESRVETHHYMGATTLSLLAFAGYDF